ncbi:response regulator transcription factor [Actinopolymorpha sp. B9G3]|uniref:response regulator transcription factor n=1 Tax=Actinopolymorpha sp. B9G3 TaxID=3158970 RepID=UPI0032D94655
MDERTDRETVTGGASPRRVLVVDDDVMVRDVVRRYLERSGHEVIMAGDGETALAMVNERHPDLVVLDLMLPGIGGIEVCARIRRSSALPVLMLTALGEEDDRILGLEVGADDYVTKPFSPRELALRVQSILRRSDGRVTADGPAPDGLDGASGQRQLADADLMIDLAARRATLGGRELALTIREFDLLSFLIVHPGTAFTRTQLLERVWGWDFGDQSTVTVHVRRLREKIEALPTQPRRIVTVWGVGYRYDRQG